MSTERRMTRLWERMAALYGSRWELEYGPVASPTGTLAPLAAIWAEALADFGGDAIATGLRKCLDRESGHPPALPEFLRLCGRRPTSQTASHQAITCDTPRHSPSDTPTARCAALAALLADTARQELTPRLQPLLPEARKEAVRAYWLAQLVDLGGIGQAVAGRVTHASHARPEAA